LRSGNEKYAEQEEGNTAYVARPSRGRYLLYLYRGKATLIALVLLLLGLFSVILGAAVAPNTIIKDAVESLGIATITLGLFMSAQEYFIRGDTVRDTRRAVEMVLRDHGITDKPTDAARSLGTATNIYAEQLAEAKTNDIQGIAASEIRLLTSYYSTVLGQARISFRWAVRAAIAGLLLFLTAVVVLLTSESQSIAIVSVIGGSIVEVLSGINFYLYGRTTTQLADFHTRLDQTQRFLLANSICEALEGDKKQEARSSLVDKIAEHTPKA
jgi:hypothetical protein